MQTDRLIRLTDDLVTLTSLDADNVAMEPEPIVLVPDARGARAGSARRRTGRDPRHGRRAPTSVRPLAAGPGPHEPAVERLEVLARGEPGDPRGRTCGRRGSVRFSVIDQGMGIAPDERSGCSSSSIGRRRGRGPAEGSGLGLSVTRRDGGRHGRRRHRCFPAGGRFDLLDHPAGARRAEHLLHRLQQGDGTERLREVFVRAHADRAFAALFAVGRDDDHLHAVGGRVGLDLHQHLGAARPGDVHVEEDQIGRIGPHAARAPPDRRRLRRSRSPRPRAPGASPRASSGGPRR